MEEPADETERTWGTTLCWVLGTAALNTALLLGWGAYSVRKKLKPRVDWKSCKMLCGKTVVITGGNSGIGKATAVDLAKRQAKVILACRTAVTAQECVSEIKELSGNDQVEYKHLDLSSFSSISSFTSELLASEPRIDILINNAAVWGNPDPLTKDGVEQTFGTNYLGHYYLTKLLLPTIAQSDIARIISVSSGLHSTYPLTEAELQGDAPSIAVPPVPVITPKDIYAKSKLCQVYYTAELQARHPEISAYCLHPGLCYTNLARYTKINPVVKSIARVVVPYLIRSSEEGAMTSVYCAVEEGLEGGAYYGSCQKEDLKDVAKEPEIQRLLWECSERMVERIEGQLKEQ